MSGCHSRTKECHPPLFYEKHNQVWLFSYHELSTNAGLIQLKLSTSFNLRRENVNERIFTLLPELPINYPINFTALIYSLICLLYKEIYYHANLRCSRTSSKTHWKHSWKLFLLYLSIPRSHTKIPWNSFTSSSMTIVTTANYHFSDLISLNL